MFKLIIEAKLRPYNRILKIFFLFCLISFFSTEWDMWFLLSIFLITIKIHLLKLGNVQINYWSKLRPNNWILKKNFLFFSFFFLRNEICDFYYQSFHCQYKWTTFISSLSILIYLETLILTKWIISHKLFFFIRRKNDNNNDF